MKFKELPMKPVVNEGHRDFFKLEKVKTSTGRTVFYPKRNPYPAGSMKAKEWQRGYNKAYRAQQKKAAQYA